MSYKSYQNQLRVNVVTEPNYGRVDNQQLKKLFRRELSSKVAKIFDRADLPSITLTLEHARVLNYGRVIKLKTLFRTKLSSTSSRNIQQG